jgi:3-oxoacyl-[acyl-carrier protein] reductase
LFLKDYNKKITMRKCALVTGGSRGIGRAIAIQLAKDHSYHIIVNYSSNETAVNETVEIITEAGGSAETLQFKVQNYAEVLGKLSTWKDNNPEDSIELLVNNAGITKDNLLLWMGEDDWNDVVDISLKGFYNVTNIVLQDMIRLRNGRIINIASISGLKGNSGQTNYSAAKGGLIAATKSLAQEVARRGITVNAIAPGFIHSDMTKDLPEKELKKFIPLRRFGKAEEIAHLVSFISSDKAAYITGEVININGGIYS